MKQIAYFDMDDTIIKHDSIAYFLLFYFKKNPIVVLRYIKLLPYYLLFILRIVDNSVPKDKMARVFKGVDVSKLDCLAKEFVNTVIPKLYYKDALKVIEEHKKNGDTLVLITASYLFYAKYIAEDLGFDKCIATELWEHKGKYTGYMYGKNCYGKEKRFRLLCDGFREIYKGSAYAYSDSISDLSLFNFASKKICVNPKKKFVYYIYQNKDGNFQIVSWK